MARLNPFLDDDQEEPDRELSAARERLAQAALGSAGGPTPGPMTELNLLGELDRPTGSFESESLSESPLASLDQVLDSPDREPTPVLPAGPIAEDTAVLPAGPIAEDTAVVDTAGQEPLSSDEPPQKMGEDPNLDFDRQSLDRARLAAVDKLVRNTERSEFGGLSTIRETLRDPMGGS